ncbi:hypothetical protein V5799_005464 [Amblyomma americanum]|uniref:FMN hydroxy acid dehydrogenase domain-containing protein n=1 Tax=Amblyomma americanum TaxID=6943 RepID=A0AAQ4DZ62_AMBAM
MQMSCAPYQLFTVVRYVAHNSFWKWFGLEFIEALPEVVAAVGGRMEVYLDGGVRSGADAAKALSLGARAVFVGRPALWGLAYNGKKGVDKVLDILWKEFNHTVQSLGCTDSNDLSEDFIER